MSKRKPVYQKKTFESNLDTSDTSANIYHSMLMSPAWKDLRASAKTLYLCCKDQYYQCKTHPVKDDPTTFFMNQSKWVVGNEYSYELYRKGNATAFYTDMRALIEHGFIDCVRSGANTREKSIYRLSSRWINYGTDAFVLDASVMTTVMSREYRKRPEEPE